MMEDHCEEGSTPLQHTAVGCSRLDYQHEERFRLHAALPNLQEP